MIFCVDVHYVPAWKSWASPIRNWILHHKIKKQNHAAITDGWSDISVFDSDTSKGYPENRPSWWFSFLNETITTGCNTELSAALAHPYSQEVTEQGVSAAEGEKEETKHDKDILPGGATRNVVPFHYKHFSHWGVSAED